MSRRLTQERLNRRNRAKIVSSAMCRVEWALSDFGTEVMIMGLDDETQTAMLDAVPNLRAFAVSLCRSADRADDLVQETLLRAIAHIGSFRPGSNLHAWLFTILRNQFLSEYRQRKRVVEDVDGKHAEALTALPEQAGWCIGEDLHGAMRKLTPHHRQALLLIGESGLSYEEAAAVCNCEVGTMKSRVHRARFLLASFMSGEDRVQGARAALQPRSARRAA
jgi:RNA polymerase sigma-70 factor, ECF subfamily